MKMKIFAYQKKILLKMMIRCQKSSWLPGRTHRVKPHPYMLVHIKLGLR